MGPFPALREFAGTRLPKRGAYQPAIRSISPDGGSKLDADRGARASPAFALAQPARRASPARRQDRPGCRGPSASTAAQETSAAVSNVSITLKRRRGESSVTERRRHCRWVESKVARARRSRSAPADRRHRSSALLSWGVCSKGTDLRTRPGSPRRSPRCCGQRSNGTILAMPASRGGGVCRGRRGRRHRRAAPPTTKRRHAHAPQ